MNQQYKEAIRYYLEHEYSVVGLFPNPINHSTDNALLFTATYLVHNPEDLEMKEKYFHFVDKCQVPNNPGLYYRYPNFVDLNAFDDQTGICLMSHMYNTHHADDIYMHGYMNNWSWNTENPGVWTRRSFFGRIPSHVAFVKACAKYHISLLDSLYASIAYLYDCFVSRDETNGRCLLYLRQKVLKGKSKVLDLSINLWKYVMMKKYPDGLKGLYTVYFKDHHPITQFAKDNFE